MTRILDTIDGPEQLRALTVPQMESLAKEIRREIIEKVSVRGGHLAPNLGVVELTMVLHYIFDTPKDMLSGILVIRHMYINCSRAGGIVFIRFVSSVVFLAISAVMRVLTMSLGLAMPVRLSLLRSVLRLHAICGGKILRLWPLSVMER